MQSRASSFETIRSTIANVPNLSITNCATAFHQQNNVFLQNFVFRDRVLIIEKIVFVERERFYELRNNVVTALLD